MLDSLYNAIYFFIFCSIVFVIISVFTYAFKADTISPHTSMNEEEIKNYLKVQAERLKLSVKICIFIVLLYVLVPNTKTVAAMYLIPIVVNNEQLQELTDTSLEILNNLTKQYLKSIIEVDL